MRHAKKWLAWLLAVLMIATTTPMALATEGFDGKETTSGIAEEIAPEEENAVLNEEADSEEEGDLGEENIAQGKDDFDEETSFNEETDFEDEVNSNDETTPEDETDSNEEATSENEDDSDEEAVPEDEINTDEEVASEDGIGFGQVITPAEDWTQMDEVGVETISLLPLTPGTCTANLSGYALPELSMVKLSDIFASANVSSNATVAWKGRNGDSYKVLHMNDTVDLLNDGYLDLDDASATFEAIVGDGNQINTTNIDYTITVQLNVDWLTAEIYTQDKNGTRKEIQQTEVDGYSSSGSNYFYYRIGVSGNSLDDESETYLGIGSNGTGAGRYDTVKVYEGTYENQGEEITGQIWNQQMGKKDAGYPLPQSYTRFTVVLLKNGAVVGHCDFYLMVEQELSIYPYLYDTATSSNASIYSLSRNYDDSNGKEYKITATLREKFSNSKNFPLRITYAPNGMSVQNALVQKAAVGSYSSLAEAAGAQDVTSSLMSTASGTGYSVGFGETQFTLFTTDGEVIHFKFILVNGDGEVNDNLNFYLYNVQTSDGKSISLFQTVNNNDSNDRYLTYLIDEDIDLTAVTVSFYANGSDSNNPPRVYADFGSGAELQEPGKGTANFSKTVHYTVVSSVDDSLSEEYWVTLIKRSSNGAKLFVNGVDSTNKATRELFLNYYAGYYHDIFIANVGSSDLTGLKVELSATNVILDEYWTVGGTDNSTLAPFGNLSYSGGEGIAKIRILPKDPIDGDGTISGTLTISADGQTPVVITLTGVAGDPRITTTTLPNGVKYVPYGSVVQTNIMYDWIESTVSISGDLPDGMEIRLNREIYGVPKETGEFPITVRLRCSGTAPNGRSYTFPTATADFTLVIKENTDANVEGSTDSGYDILVWVPKENTSIAQHEFRSNGEYGEFIDFWIDGEKMVKGTDYTSESGSTKITIFQQTFRNHSATGRHTIAAEFREGGNVDQELHRAAQNYYIGRTSNNGSSSSSGGRDRDRDSSSSRTSTSTANSSATLEQITMTIFNQPFTISIPRNGATYFVRAGDTLAQIAQNYYGSYLLYPALAEANAETLARTNGVLYVGMILILPAQLNGVPRLSTPVLAAGESMYTIKAGDTLSQIAADVYGDASQYVAIYQRNRDRIADPNLIYVGQNIVLPVVNSQVQETRQVTTSVAGAYAYTVKEGDTLRGIAKAIFGDEKKWKTIYHENLDKIEYEDEIYPGQILTIPTK